MKIKFNKMWFLAICAVAITSANLAQAESWGVNFLGRTGGTNVNSVYAPGADNVTGTAGVVPIPNWNNISNITYTTGTIHSSDGLSTATLAISGTTKGQGDNGGWQSSATLGNGGDTSLVNGYLDLGSNFGVGPETNIISGLTGSSYTLYIYNFSDASHPGNGGDLLPNYSVNGIVYYAPQLGVNPTTWTVGSLSVGGPFTGWKKAKSQLSNSNARIANTNDFGNYIEVDNVVPVGGQINFIAMKDYTSWRSPLDGFELVLETSAIPPSIDAQSASSTNFAGSTVQVQVVANGTPLNFQWQAGVVGSGTYTNLTNGGQFSGVTNATLVISNFTPNNVADYIVIITNSAGSVTSSVPTTLSVAPMSINGPTPASSMVYPNESAFFNVTVAGAEPLTYRWRKNGAVLSNGGHISGANTNKLVISNADGTDAATYDVIVTNAFDSVTSSPAIFGLAATPTAGSYDENVKTNGAVAYWRLNETAVDPTTGSAVAYDFIGGRAGAYGASTLNGFNGITGPASPTWPGLATPNYAVQIFPAYTNSFVGIPAIEALNLNTNTVTITAWLNPNTLVINAGVVFQRQNGVVGIALNGTGGLGFNWNDNSVSWSWNPGLTPPINQWSYVALVVTPTKTTMYMYNTTTWTNATLDFAAANAGFGGPLNIGTDTQDPAGRAFDGLIDEVAIFNRALSPVEIAAQVSVAAGVTVPPLVPVVPTIGIQPSGANVQLTWTGTLLQSTNVSGPWTTNTAGPSPLMVTPAGPQMFYRSK